MNDRELGIWGFLKDLFGLLVVTVILTLFLGVIGTIIGVILFFITAVVRIVQMVKYEGRE